MPWKKRGLTKQRFRPNVNAMDVCLVVEPVKKMAYGLKK